MNLDTTEYFVRRQYLEFLGREPGKQALTSGVRAIANDQTVGRIVRLNAYSPLVVNNIEQWN